MNGSARVVVAFDGSGVNDFWGRAVDADGDGIPGGQALISFDTLNLTPVAGTAVIGTVYASELVPGPDTGTNAVNKPLPGVTITVTNEATGITREAVTGPEGQFVVPTLSPGTYTVRADLPGFQSQEQTGLVLRVGQEVEVDMMSTGEPRETVYAEVDGKPLALVGMAVYAYFAIRRSGLAHPNVLALHWTVGSALFTLFGAGLLGLAHTWPSVNKWTHGTLITAMHGHSAFYGAYAMIVLAMISYAMPSISRHRSESGSAVGYFAFWLQMAGMFGMTISFATAGIGQVYLERILGLGYLDTQLKIQVHFLMLMITASVFSVGVALYIWDFFRAAPTFDERREGEGARAAGTAPA